jgi:2,4-dienoyl-CoA reductase-like NADH-dependent reductase (Old Yellow Enzyme family)
MSENLSTPKNRADARMATLYGRWADGGAGLLITGNIMIDGTALGEPHNVVIESQPKVGGHLLANDNHSSLRAWAQAGTRHCTHLWAQLNHPGKQSPRFLSPKPVAPSAIGLKPPLNRLFNLPRALTEAEILDLIARFGYAAGVVQAAGFTGVQIHGAHGYLVSQFLSPLHNQRTDAWGGSLENRMRFAVEVYRSIRKAVGPGFPVGIKLNSADFQKGGFSPEDSMAVVTTLSELGMDLVEISGGTYESPEMTGVHHRASTAAREAYFLKYCEEVRKRVSTPLMLTGGFRSLEGMDAALESGACDVIGLARTLALDPDFPKRLLTDPEACSEVRPLTTGAGFLDRLIPLEITWYAQQIHRMAAGREPKPNLSVLGSALSTLLSIGAQGLKRVRA